MTLTFDRVILKMSSMSDGAGIELSNCDKLHWNMSTHSGGRLWTNALNYVQPRGQPECYMPPAAANTRRRHNKQFRNLYRNGRQTDFTSSTQTADWESEHLLSCTLFSERELMFTFAICRRASVCRLSVTFVHPTQAIEIFGNVSAPFNTLVTWRHPGKILRRSSQGNPSVGG